MENLNSCPFCGEKRIYRGFHQFYDRKNYRECPRCLAVISGYDTPEEADAAWNVRTDTNALRNRDFEWWDELCGNDVIAPEPKAVKDYHLSVIIPQAIEEANALRDQPPPEASIAIERILAQAGLNLEQMPTRYAVIFADMWNAATHASRARIAELEAQSRCVSCNEFERISGLICTELGIRNSQYALAEIRKLKAQALASGAVEGE